MIGMPSMSGSSAVALSMESAKQRIRTLENENRRLMSGQGQLVADANRKVEMHLNEIRMLKEELKSVRSSNRQLQDLCCFLEEDRQKTRQLSKEWQRFGRYTSELMKQEITTYQQRLQEQDQRHKQLLAENDELKRLCLYLDEQRQAIIAQATAMAEEAAGTHVYYNNSHNGNDNDSSDAGCGSSEKSDSEKEFGKMTSSCCQTVENQVEFDHEQEKTLRVITQQMQTSMLEEGQNPVRNDVSHSMEAHNDRLFNYIHSLESRIQLLEHQGPPNSSSCNNRFSKSSFGSDDLSSAGGMNHDPNDEDLEEDSVHEAFQKMSKLSDKQEAFQKPLQILSQVHSTDSSNQLGQGISRNSFCKNMMDSTTSTMTSSGTTYCSSETDESAATAVFVMGDEDSSTIPRNLEVRTLGPIDEEQENDVDGGSCCSEASKFRKRSLLNLKSLSPLKLADKRSSSSSTDSAQSSYSSTTSSSNCATSFEVGLINEPDLPPKMPLLTDPSTRLSLCSSNLSLDRCSNSSSSKLSNNTNRSCPEDYNSLGRNKGPPSYSQVQLRHRPSFNCPPFSGYSRPRQQIHSTLAEAVKSFQSGDDPKVLRDMCQNAWEALSNTTKESSMSAQITAV